MRPFLWGTAMAGLNDIFQQYLGRDADAGGAAYWQDQINNGMSLDQVRSNIAASNEYKAIASQSTQPFVYVDNDNNAATAPVLGNNSNSFAKFTYNPDGTTSVSASGTGEKFNTFKVGGNGLSAALAPAKPAAASASMPAYARRDDSVANALTKLTSQDSQLMRQAQTSGLQTANRRGLLNSSMAVKAAEDAAYAAAVPIASQDAAQANTENMANLDASTRLQLQSLSDAGQMDRLNASIGATNTQQQNEINYQTAMKQLDRGLQEKLAKMNLDESQRGSAAQSVLASQELYNNRINNIMANTNLSAEDRTAQLASAKSFFDIQMDLVQQMYDVSLKWQ